MFGYSDQLDNYEAVSDLTVLNDGSETEGVGRLCSIIAGTAPDVMIAADGGDKADGFWLATGTFPVGSSRRRSCPSEPETHLGDRAR